MYDCKDYNGLQLLHLAILTCLLAATLSHAQQSNQAVVLETNVNDVRGLNDYHSAWNQTQSAERGNKIMIISLHTGTSLIW